MTDTADGPLTQIKAVIPNCISIHCILHHYTDRVKKKASFTLNVFRESVKLGNIVKY